ncbi:TPA: hypothetical protein N0F65_000704 [Lagenidium giganteum]|uniref:Gag protein n=1 Tax=Lagenidium giganteum TaxID=4803 RepID=A0AAV2YW64_9STRA|nr:TPA: hypothetical protein N0F65_000704 [Lagenidium giganteum]
MSYEAKIRSRCASTNEKYDNVAVGIKGSVEPRLLEHLARYVLRKPLEKVTDEDVGLEITRRCKTLQNDHIPDLDKLFRDNLRMDLQEIDTDARVLKYFMRFDQIVDEYGLESMLGSGRETEPDYDERMKLRCKHLLNNIGPVMLRLEMERLAAVKPALKKDDLLLYEMLAERAREQQKYHTLAQELKQTNRSGSNNKKHDSKGARSRERRPAKGTEGPSPGKQPDAARPKQREPPRDGCLVCQGPHWVKHCPQASEQEKEQALQRMKDMKNKRFRAKKAESRVRPGERAAIVNASWGQRRTKLGADPPAKLDHYGWYSRRALFHIAPRQGSTQN